MGIKWLIYRIGSDIARNLFWTVELAASERRKFVKFDLRQNPDATKSPLWNFSEISFLLNNCRPFAKHYIKFNKHAAPTCMQMRLHHSKGPAAFKMSKVRMKIFRLSQNIQKITKVASFLSFLYKNFAILISLERPKSFLLKKYKLTHFF